MTNNVNRQESNYEKLVKNTAIFAIGSFGSKVLSILIVPLYTYVLSTAEYGRIDLFTTGVNLLLPFTTLLIQEALLRFLMGKDIDNRDALSGSLLVFIVGSIISILLFPVYKTILKLDNLIYVFELVLIFSSFTNIFSQYLRAIGKNVEFTINGIINTFVFLSCNVLFLVVLKIGMKGYLYSLLISQIVCSIYIAITSKMFNQISFKNFDYSILKRMLLFSIPLIPNTLMWWIMSAGDKYIINYFLGDSYNGLFSMAMKVPTTVVMLFTLFYQAWQMSAIEVKNKSNEKEFYEKVFKTTNCFLAFLVAGGTMFVKMVFHILEKSYIPSWQYVPLLLVATLFSCCASFFDVVYTVSLKSHKAFYTTFIGAVVNIVFNYILIHRYGLYGIAIGTALGCIAITGARMIDAKKEIGMEFDSVRSLIMIVVLVTQALLTCVYQNFLIYVAGIISLLILLILYKKEISDILKFVLNKIQKKTT